MSRPCCRTYPHRRRCPAGLSGYTPRELVPDPLRRDRGRVRGIRLLLLQLVHAATPGH